MSSYTNRLTPGQPSFLLPHPHPYQALLNATPEPHPAFTLNNQNGAHTWLDLLGCARRADPVPHPRQELARKAQLRKLSADMFLGQALLEKFPNGRLSNTHINYLHNTPGACGWTVEDKTSAWNREEPPHDRTEL